MRRLSYVYMIVLLIEKIFAQSQFDPQAYYRFLEQNRNLTTHEFLSMYAPPNSYYTGTAVEADLDQYAYMDEIRTNYQLTDDELDMLKKHQFVVTERLGWGYMGRVLFDIYERDLPVFITTDAILQALHASYAEILMDLEIEQLQPKLIELLNRLYSTFPQILNTYGNSTVLYSPLEDVDLYITIAKSLLMEERIDPHLVDTDVVDQVWKAIKSEQYVKIPLFSERGRHLDFSQFHPRGHYTKEYYDGEGWKTLEAYFRTMMWLGRIDFLMTPPPYNPWEPAWMKEEILRMNMGALLLNELIDLSNGRSLVAEINEMLCIVVGESDNLTPAELKSIVADLNLRRPDYLMFGDKYAEFQDLLITSQESAQKILGNILITDPFNPEPGQFPVSFRLLGQRFTIDSNIFSNVVYDRIVYNNHKVWRPLPDPLDVMFVLGNDNAGYLLREELDKYHYAIQMAALRYLVEAWDDSFWDETLYNSWLQTIRTLNPAVNRQGLPFFMKTVAWQQEKLNTQLASWAQLRHDNVLYVKQSYTSGGTCSFPHSYVEPVPGFYRQIGRFARQAGLFLDDAYFDRLESVMDTLSTLAQKQLDRIGFNDDEKTFLQQMLFGGRIGCTDELKLTGWYADLFYDRSDAAEQDFLIADVHTQPTDEAGNKVGHVLHTGVGKVNLGIFLSDAPTDGYRPMAYVGPVFSYYEKVTENFQRLNDEQWAEMVGNDDVPPRPDWVNVYLADKNGHKMEEGRALAGEIYTHIVEPPYESLPSSFCLYQNTPNPFNPSTVIRFDLPESSQLNLTVFNVLGQEIRTLLDGVQPAGTHSVEWDGRDAWGRDAASGVYLYKLCTEGGMQVRKMFLLR